VTIALIDVDANNARRVGANDVANIQ
jgi:hypothetical protein